MSYESRRTKRAKRRVVLNAARSNRNERTDHRYFLIDAKRDGRCAAHGCRIKRGDQIVFRKSGPLTLCVLCAQADQIVWPLVRPSASWELRHHRPVKRGPAWMAEAS